MSEESRFGINMGSRHLEAKKSQNQIREAPSWFLFRNRHQMSKLTVFCYVFSFLKSTAPRPEDSSLVNQKGNTDSCSSSHSSSSLLFDDSGQVYIFFVETVKQHGEKMPAVCLKEEKVVVCMSCPAPVFLKVSTVGCASWSWSPIVWPVRAMD